MINKLLISIDCHERYDFFSALAEILGQINIKCFFVSSKYSIYRQLTRSGFESTLLGKTDAPPCSECKAAGAYEVKTGKASVSKAAQIYADTYQIVGDLFSREKFDGCLVWNGEKISDVAVKDFCCVHEIPTLYLEIANFPGKLFADRFGVNLKSEVYSSPVILDKYQVCESDFLEWKSNYLESKKQAHHVPQSVRRRKNLKESLLDWCGYLMFGAHRIDASIGGTIFQNVYRANKSKIKFDDINENEEYVFLPLQVSDDTQLLINSHIDNFGAISAALKIARDQSCQLVVKPHPAENNRTIFEKLQLIRELERIKIVDGNTFNLIAGSKEVVTINSTVGLEARLVGKKVTLLAESYYKYIEDRRLPSLIMGYFLDVDYFHPSNITLLEAKAVISRLERATW